MINSFAIQAGREIRVMVSSDEVSDERAVMLAKDVAKKIETEMTYPGQIKVNVIRETRAIDHAVKLLFIGDIIGKPGRQVISRELHRLVDRYMVDLVIANGENAGEKLNYRRYCE